MDCEQAGAKDRAKTIKEQVDAAKRAKNTLDAARQKALENADKNWKDVSEKITSLLA